MQSKALLKRLKRLEQSIIKSIIQYVFFDEPTQEQLALIPYKANVVIFIDEDKLED